MLARPTVRGNVHGAAAPRRSTLAAEVARPILEIA
jgi:hypothetical protein